jgi:3-hydroxymyristoyl/3-hydroxydecanoyl-(acyl carrier protein) dehydratase
MKLNATIENAAMKKQKALSIPTNHPAFAGHFPSTPIVPGVVLLDEVMHAIVTDTGLPATDWQVSSVKFLSPLKPGESIIIEHEQSANGAIKFEVLCEGLVKDNRKIVTGNLVLKSQPFATPLSQSLDKEK